jgi:hypothetical protein
MQQPDQPSNSERWAVVLHLFVCWIGKLTAAPCQAPSVRYQWVFQVLSGQLRAETAAEKSAAWHLFPCRCRAWAGPREGKEGRGTVPLELLFLPCRCWLRAQSLNQPTSTIRHSRSCASHEIDSVANINSGFRPVYSRPPERRAASSRLSFFSFRSPPKPTQFVPFAPVWSSRGSVL